MTSKDINAVDVDDEEFAAFLQGKGVLAEMLKEIPQPTASAELDAAILARAEQAIALEARPKYVAANDSVMPGAQRVPSRFSRWQVPFGIAASVVLTFSLVLLQSHDQSSNSARTIVAAAPESANRADLGTPMQNVQKTTDHTQLAKAATTLSASETGSQSADSVGEAAMPYPANDGGAKQKSAPSDSDTAGSLGFRNRVLDVAPAPAPATLSKKVEAVESNSIQSFAPQADARTAATEPASRSAGAPIPFPSESVGASVGAPAMAADHGGNIGMPSKRTTLSAQATEQSPEDARIWLEKIEKLINAGMHKEARAEWANFHRTYPNYPIPKTLQQQLGL